MGPGQSARGPHTGRSPQQCQLCALLRGDDAGFHRVNLLHQSLGHTQWEMYQDADVSCQLQSFWQFYTPLSL